MKKSNDSVAALVPSWPNAQPTKETPFTFAEVKACIPAHCFKRDTLRSLSFVACDLAMIAAMGYMATFIDQVGSSGQFWFAPYVLWPMYWWWQGAVMTGIWVIAHECGHRAFSDNIAVGDAVGMVLHSALLVPYHPWRISHAKHHKNTNSMEGDEVFVPYTRDQVGEHPSHADEMPGPLVAIYRFCSIFKMLAFGWPAYLAMNVTGHQYDRHTDHFQPSSPLFNKKQWAEVVMSDVMLCAVAATIAYCGVTFGWGKVAFYYFIPYMITNMWLVMITDLQHTDPRLPHYREGAFTWFKGAMATMDRDYGVMNVLHHHIGDTHVVHHMFSTMPHYHAQEASVHVKKLLGEYYIEDDVPPGLFGIAQALWKTATHCRFVDNDGDVLWWNRTLDDAHGITGAASKKSD